MPIKEIYRSPSGHRAHIHAGSQLLEVMLTAQSPPSPHLPPPPSSAAELHAHSPHPAARCGPQPTGPPLLSPRAAGLPLLPFSMPWGQQLSWLSVRSYPLCRNLRRATLLPSSPAGPRCQGAGWEPRSVVTGEKQRGKETGAQIWLCFAFFLPLVIFTKLSFFSHHTLNYFCCGSTALVLWQVCVICPSFWPF